MGRPCLGILLAALALTSAPWRAAATPLLEGGPDYLLVLEARSFAGTPDQYELCLAFGFCAEPGVIHNAELYFDGNSARFSFSDLAWSISADIADMADDGPVPISYDGETLALSCCGLDAEQSLELTRDFLRLGDAGVDSAWNVLSIRQIPEPSTAALLALGILGLAGRPARPLR